jgi:hypothetical protein
MRHALLALALISGCTRHNSGNGPLVCTPGEQRACACIGAPNGVQICNPLGTALGECLGCPGGPGFDLANPFADLSGELFDLTQPTFDFPPGTDLTGFNPFADLAGADLSIPPDDLAMSMDDLAQPVDMSVPPADLSGVDLAGVVGCPVVMLVLDTSGSMSIDFTDVPGTTHIEGAQVSLDKAVDNYNGRVPLGFNHYDSSATCNSGIVTGVEPGAGTTATLKSVINATAAGGSTNTGDAISVIAADPNMHQSGRQGSFIVLVTDGAGNCEQTDPSFTVTQIDTAAKAVQPIKTYVIALDPEAMGSDEGQMELMANAGQRPCTSGFCKGHKYYPAPDPAHLDKALDLVLNDIVKSVGASCGGFACFPAGAACGGGTSCCGTVGCKNLNTDAENCGQCGTSCGSGGSCSGGTCHCGAQTCPAGDSCCSGSCCSSVDMRPAADLRPPPDMPLRSCVCSGACTFGCSADGCCFDLSNCSPTPNICSCTGILC